MALSVQHPTGSYAKRMMCIVCAGCRLAVTVPPTPPSSKPIVGMGWAQTAFLLDRLSAFPCWAPTRCWIWNEKSCNEKNHWVTLAFESLVRAIHCRRVWSVTRVKCLPAG